MTSQTMSIESPSSSRQGILILLAITVPMLIAYLVFKTGFGVSGDTVNKGTLLTPATSIKPLDIKDENGLRVDLLSGEKRWRMVIVGDGACADNCLQQLYLSRQVHVRLAEKATRVERVYLNTSSRYETAFAEKLESEHIGMKTYSIDPQQWQSLFANTSASSFALDGSHIYLLDQEGFAMMTYDLTEKGNGMLTDIKRLLRYSYQ